MKERLTKAGRWLRQNRVLCVLMAAGCAAEGLFLLLRQDRAAMDGAARLALAVRGLISGAADLLPFSLAELLWTALGVWLLVMAVVTVRAQLRHRRVRPLHAALRLFDLHDQHVRTDLPRRKRHDLALCPQYPPEHPKLLKFGKDLKYPAHLFIRQRFALLRLRLRYLPQKRQHFRLKLARVLFKRVVRIVLLELVYMVALPAVFPARI